VTIIIARAVVRYVYIIYTSENAYMLYFVSDFSIRND